MRENNREQVRSKERICFVSKHTGKTENSCLHNRRDSSVVNEPTSVGIGPVSSFSSNTIYTVENQRNKVRIMEQICFVTKHNSNTENSKAE